MFESRNGHWHIVVGISADVRNNGLSDPPEPEYYLVRKHVQDDVFGNGSSWRSIFAIVRSSLAPQVVARELRSSIAQLDPTLPVDIEPMREHVEALTARPRFTATLLAMFSAAALLLAAIGIYGVIAFLVSQRTREIGVRMALGATPGAIRKLFLGYAARWTAVGIAIGLLGSIFETRLVSTLLFHVRGNDPWILVSASLILLLLAVTAAWLPSRRAAAIDPAHTLREE